MLTIIHSFRQGKYRSLFLLMDEGVADAWEFAFENQSEIMLPQANFATFMILDFYTEYCDSDRLYAVAFVEELL